MSSLAMSSFVEQQIVLHQFTAKHSVQARAMLGWSREHLARQAGIAVDAVQRFESHAEVEDETRLSRFFTWLTTKGQTSCVNAQDCLCGCAWITRMCNSISKFRLQQISPILWCIFDDVLVYFEGQYAVIIAVPVTISILGISRD